MPAKFDHHAELSDFFRGDVPAYVKAAGPRRIVINVGDYAGSRALRVTRADVAEYDRRERGSLSGGRSLAGHFGDWRQMDGLADLCRAWFEHCDRDVFCD